MGSKRPLTSENKFLHKMQERTKILGELVGENISAVLCGLEIEREQYSSAKKFSEKRTKLKKIFDISIRNYRKKYRVWEGKFAEEFAEGKYAYAAKSFHNYLFENKLVVNAVPLHKQAPEKPRNSQAMAATAFAPPVKATVNQDALETEFLWYELCEILAEERKEKESDENGVLFDDGSFRRVLPDGSTEIISLGTSYS